MKFIGRTCVALTTNRITNTETVGNASVIATKKNSPNFSFVQKIENFQQKNEPGNLFVIQRKSKYSFFVLVGNISVLITEKCIHAVLASSMKNPSTD